MLIMLSLRPDLPARQAALTAENPVGTIWIACGSEDDIVTLKLEEDKGRDLNLANATSSALQLFLNYLTERLATDEKTDADMQ